jgi:triosephosphate isomerase
MRKPIIAANWKLNKGPSDTEDFIKSFENRLSDLPKGVDIVIASPFVSLQGAGLGSEHERERQWSLHR